MNILSIFDFLQEKRKKKFQAARIDRFTKIREFPRIPTMQNSRSLDMAEKEAER